MLMIIRLDLFIECVRSITDITGYRMDPGFIQVFNLVVKPYEKMKKIVGEKYIWG